MNGAGRTVALVVGGMLFASEAYARAPAPVEDEATPTDDVGQVPGTEDAGDGVDEASEPDAEDVEEPVAPPPKSSHSVWASPDPAEGDVPEADLPPPEPAAAAPAGDDDDLEDGPIGGYLHATETKEIPPPDGHRQIIAGSILLPLGTLATATGALSVWATNPDHCRERLDRLGSGIDEKHCPGLYVLNIIRVTYGSLMVASGAVLLGIGLHNRDRSRKWHAQHHTSFVPVFTRDFRGASVSLRF